jgi:hypothetical protein
MRHEKRSRPEHRRGNSEDARFALLAKDLGTVRIRAHDHKQLFSFWFPFPKGKGLGVRSLFA